jgi:serine/threonine protein kinase
MDKFGNIKICDFGWSAENVGVRNTFCGTLEYMSPEMLSNKV